MRIDSHHHLWRYNDRDYVWMTDGMDVLRRDYLPADLAACLSAADIDGTVVVQARQRIEETAWLCAEYEIPLTIVNPTCVVGAGAVPIDIWGARDPKFFQRLLDGKRITIPNDGQGLIQLGNVADIADCFVLALDNPDRTGVYNASSRYAITHNYYVELLGQALGVAPRVRHMPVEKIIKRWPKKLTPRGIRFFAAHMCFTMRKAERELGYDPKITPEMSVEESVRWMLDEGLITRP